MLSPTSAVIEDYLSDLEAYLKTLNHADLNSSQLKKNLALFSLVRINTKDPIMSR